MGEDIFELKGKSAVVTGGSRGIGLMIAEGLVKAGVRVFISSRKAEVCDEVAASLSKHGECISIPADLSTASGIEHLGSELATQSPELHILVNNAGTAWGAPLEEYPPESFNKVWAVNVQAPFQLTQKLLPQLKAAASAEDPARVINIGSIDGLRVPALENYAYSASKAGIHQLSRHMASALVGHFITVNAIAPGLFPSRMTKFMFETDGAEQALASAIPLQRVGRPDDMAGTVIFLSSRAGSYVTGAVIPVDGGAATLR